MTLSAPAFAGGGVVKAPIAPAALRGHGVAAAGGHVETATARPARSFSTAGATLALGSAIVLQSRLARRAKKQRLVSRRATAVATKQDISSSPGGAGGEGKLLDIVQLSSAIYYVDKDDSVLHAEVLRLGEMKGKVSVEYFTEETCAKSANFFEPQQGTLTFEDGEVQKVIAIPITGTEEWSGTLEFILQVKNPQNCELGKYLDRSRVKVIEYNCFPSNTYAEQIRNNDIESIPGPALLIDYFKMNLRVQEGMTRDSLITAAIAQAPALYFLLTTYILQWVGDDVLQREAKDGMTFQVEEDLVAATALYILPSVFIYFLQKWKVELDLPTRSCGLLQENIFRKYMDMDTETRSKVTVSDISLAVTREVDEIVNAGFMGLFELAGNTGKILCVAYFLLSENQTAIFPIIVYGSIVPLVFALTYERTAELNETVAKKATSMLDVVQQSGSNYRLIADYFQRPLVQERMVSRVNDLNKAKKPVEIDAATKEAFSVGLSSLCVGAYLAWGATEVVNGHLQVGTFVATINVFKEVGEVFEEAFKTLLEIGTSIAPLQKVTKILNSPTRFNEIKELEDWRRNHTTDIRTPEKLRELRIKSGQRFGSDAIPIEIEDLSFTYSDGRRILSCVNLEVQQGTYVAVVGPQHGGKGTFMRLLGQTIYPTQGHVYIPSHLRVLHVAEEPQILDGGLWKNLALKHHFGNDEEDQRIIRICQRLGFSDRMMGLLMEEYGSGKDAQDQGSDWQNRVSTTDQALINIARALIYNAEVLVLNRPSGQLSQEMADNVARLLREMVDNRGLELCKETALTRRPRTVFVSGVRVFELEQADMAIQVKDKVANVIPYDEVPRDSLL